MEKIRRNKSATILITLIRISVGWHFLYEGIVKVMAGSWTSEGYLLGTTGFFSGFYHWIADSAILVKITDILNIYGLLIIGIALFLGMFVRVASWCGVLLLLLYYFAYPPFGNRLFDLSEGHLFIVNRQFIECVILATIAMIPYKGYGIDAIINGISQKKKAITDENRIGTNSRREVLKNLAAIPVLGFLGWGGLKNYRLFGEDVTSGATIQLKRTSLNELNGILPKGKIGKNEISRLVAGGNLIGGWAHARDLLYAESLFKAYNTEKKVYETLMLCEQAGINTINIGFISNDLMQKYKRITGSKIKVISQVPPDLENNNYFGFINKAIDFGADILQVHGYYGDMLVRDKKTEVIGLMIEKIRSYGMTAGLGAHEADTFVVCEENGIVPDYYMLTMHHDRYWSAHPRENRFPYEIIGENSTEHNKYHDNLFCSFPDKAVEFVNRTKVPVMGFKVLAAGAIEPKDGFRWAFENGADFICVGMFDFQVVEDVNIALEVLGSLNRTRAWMA